MTPVSVSTAAATPTAIERQKNELARILNVDGIKTGNPKWLALMREGVVVKLHVRRWRAKSRLDLNDLGLPSEADDLIGDLLNLGDKRLLPKDLASSPRSHRVRRPEGPGTQRLRDLLGHVHPSQQLRGLEGRERHPQAALPRRPQRTAATRTATSSPN